MESFLIKQAHHATREFVVHFKRAMAMVFAEYQLTRLDGKIMLMLKKGQANTKAQLAQYLHIKQAGLTRSLDRLVEQGYVIREIDVDDKRYVRLSLSQQGHELGKKVRKAAHDIWKKLFIDCSEQEIEIFINIMHKMNATC